MQKREIATDRRIGMVRYGVMGRRERGWEGNADSENMSARYALG